MLAGLHPTLAAAKAFATTDFRPDLKSFTVPTLIIHGTKDATVPIDATFVDTAVANETTTVTFAGPSDGFALLMLGDALQQPIATSFGPLLVDPSSLSFIDIVHLPAALTGYVSKDYFVPSSALNGHAYAVQSLTLSPAGVLGLTQADTFCVGWEFGRIP